MCERITCHNCQYCKIWYDKDMHTMRLSCTKTSKRGKCITWKSYPLYTKINGITVPTEDTIESITKEFEDYAKRRISPKWCEYRKTNTQPPQKGDIDEDEFPYKYLISYATTGMIFGHVTLSRKNKIDSFDEVNSVIEFIEENCVNYLNIPNINVAILNIILLNE